ncbi:hypothetical protein L1994_10490 [Methanomicrobium antiquum]|uniref:Uncharacterized protein n=1 Tax=Methanomicrobium antiquum TaxID=487686 RepID=A0AAF0JTN3_9EURY|nr:hypothetical protein [Methanomicrobium antiquum]WFN36553.1 hypothetical protein L1994_10490 [Methanomicrobium antiquum]
MEKKIKNKIILIFAVSMTVFCLFTGGCTSQTESSSEVTVPADSGINPGEMRSEEMPPGGMNVTGNAEGMGEPGDVRGGPDLNMAAETLGVTVEELETVLGNIEGKLQVDLDAAASELGVTVEELEDALGPLGNRAMPEGTSPAES